MLTRALARCLARPLAGPLAGIVVCLLLVAGCRDQVSETASPTAEDSTTSTPTDAPSTSTPSPTETASESASPSASESASADPSPSTGARGTLRSRLLTADELPGFNAEYRWRQGRTAPENPSTSFGTCQRFGILSIGAERAVVRGFRPASGPAGTDRAGELVATFPDEKTARRAYAVLEAWRGKCADRLARHKSSEVGALQNVPVNGGTAGWYLLTYGPVKGDPDAGFFDAQGMTRVGSRIAMVSMVLVGQDYNYEAGQEPMVEALRRAARKLS